MMKLLDHQVGEIVQKVKDLGLSENTLIIFTSDNGPHLEGGADPDYFDSNGPLRGYKRDLYEGGIRVPMIAYWPETIHPGISDHVSAFWDVLPTFAALIGQPIPPIDGISFLPTLLQQQEQPKHEYLYWEFHEKGGRQAVRKGNFKAVRYDVFENPNTTPELYDLSKDIGEQQNIAEQYPWITTEMENIMATTRIPSEVFEFGDETYLVK
jgi:arylsulfatase A-like enzyme